MNTSQILDVEVPVWFDALERFYWPWKMAYFRPFSNVSIKTSIAARKKYLQHGVMDDVTCKSSTGAHVLYVPYAARPM
jgi:hypothetical protein